MPDTPGVALIISEVSDAVRRAYAEGYRRGSLEAVEKMTRAVNVTPGVATTAIDSSGVHLERVDAKRPQPTLRTDLTTKSYGRVITAIRHALLVSQDKGVTRDGIMEFCAFQGVDVTINQYRDAMKRLSGGEELSRDTGGLFFPGPKFRSELVQADGMRSFKSEFAASFNEDAKQNQEAGAAESVEDA